PNTVQVTVSSPAGTSNAQSFSYPAPPPPPPPPSSAPTISSISPSSAPFATGVRGAVISGTNFAGATCRVNGVPVSCTVGAGNTTITLDMPPQSGSLSVFVEVVTSAGRALTPFRYT